MGYPNYYSQCLALNEIGEERLFGILDELERNGVETIATSGLIRVHRDESGKVTREEPGALPVR